MAVIVSNPNPVDLNRFRRRIMLLRAWRMSALGGSIGAGIAILLLAADWQDLWDARPWQLAALVGLGLLGGIIAILFERYSDAQIARSIDHRSNLDDRLTTACEAAVTADDPFLDAVRGDAARHITDVQPAQLYPLRVHRFHWLLLGMVALCAVLYLAIDTPLFKSLRDRLDIEKLKNAAVQIQQISKPVIEQANKPGASSEDKQLAHDLKRFTQDLQKGRMNQQQAMIKANQLAEQASQMEAKHNLALSQSLNKAQTAGAKLQQLADQGKMEKTDAAKLADKASALQQQMAKLQQQLDAAKAGKSNLNKAEQDALQKKLAAMGKQLQQIQLSEQAQQTFEKLQSMPEFQQAMNILSKLQQQSNAMQNGQPSQLTKEQMQQMANQLEQLAKQLSTDAAMKAYAQQLLEAAKEAREAQPGDAAAQMMAAFGMGSGGSSSQGGLSLGMGGKGAPTEDHWVGDHGTLQHFDKSSLLHIKYQDRVIRSQQGKTGSETYTEEMGPAQLGNKPGIPYQDVLPKYEKSAETALDKGDVPPEMRTKVRDYFDSLRQNQ